MFLLDGKERKCVVVVFSVVVVVFSVVSLSWMIPMQVYYVGCKKFYLSSLFFIWNFKGFSSKLNMEDVQNKFYYLFS